MSHARIPQDYDDIRKALWYLKQASPFAENNSSVGSIVTSVIATEVERMEGNDVFKYSLNVMRRLKLYQRKQPLNVIVKVKLLLCLNCYFKG